ncbi:GNAT family N-acetyltransferase [Catenuloplanes sp. NPDC051500]|uniref:GNAT family N-acetyltransferase n=1 Tax=Catenuloplanes sp. NPDC051500 TaxID=3363959 RepID=UPI003795B20A
MTIAITPFDVANDAELEVVAGIMRGAAPADNPGLPVLSTRRYRARFRNPQLNERRLSFLARVDGVPAGVGVLILPDAVNRDTAMIELIVLPEFRRRGTGRALHDRLISLARTEGRTTVLASTSEGLPPGLSHAAPGQSHAVSDPFQAASDPSHAASDPFQAASDPFQAASDPFQAASDPSQAASDPSHAAPDLSHAAPGLSRAATEGPLHAAAGSAFAAALGYRRASTAFGRLLDLDEVPVGRLSALVAPYTGGYTPVVWSGEVPDEDVRDIAYLNGRLLTDAPTGDIKYEGEKPDPAVIRNYEQAYRDKHSTLFHAAMRDDATGHLVAWTMVEQLDEPRSWGWQQITLVDPAHRGRRLGLAVKLHNHRQLRAAAPELRWLHTWNSAANTHMNAINESLGFRPSGTTVDWQTRL